MYVCNLLEFSYIRYVCSLLEFSYQAVDGISQRVDDTTEKIGTDWNVDNCAGSFHYVTFLDHFIVAENDDADVVRLQIQRHSLREESGFVATPTLVMLTLSPLENSTISSAWQLLRP